MQYTDAQHQYINKHRRSIILAVLRVTTNQKMTRDLSSQILQHFEGERTVADVLAAQCDVHGVSARLTGHKFNAPSAVRLIHEQRVLGFRASDLRLKIVAATRAQSTVRVHCRQLETDRRVCARVCCLQVHD
jgi:hypothetical protein